MSAPASSAAPLPFSDYDTGAAYPPLTTLPPLAGPNAFGPTADPARQLPTDGAGRQGLSNRAQALKARLANSSGAPEAGEDSTDSFAHPSIRAANPLSQSPTFQPPPTGDSMAASATMAPQPLPQSYVSLSAPEISDANTPAVPVHAYGPPVWRTGGHRPGNNSTANIPPTQLDRILQLLEQRSHASPDTTTEDLVSLAFVGMFFMLAVHALTPPAPYRR